MRHILFLCSQNRLRSPTAEQVYSTEAAAEVASAGLDNDAETVCTPELLQWADIVFVMEKPIETGYRSASGNISRTSR